MRMAPPMPVARVSAETSASAGLDEVCRWLVECQGNPVRLDVPALGQGTRLLLESPMTAPKAVLCALWLLEDVEAGACVLAGHLRFVAHPTGSPIKLSFTGRIATAMRSDLLRQADHAARQLLQLIVEAIERPAGLNEAPVPI